MADRKALKSLPASFLETLIAIQRTRLGFAPTPLLLDNMGL